MDDLLYLSEEGVRQYLISASESNGRAIIDILKTYVKRDSHVLELGSGPGNDVLHELYPSSLSYSDYSPIFLAHLRKKFPSFRCIELDAKNFNLHEQFDLIYSNKVLHHLRTEELKRSIKLQLNHLADGGLLCHSFWAGNRREEHAGLAFNHYLKEEIEELFQETDILYMGDYSEFIPGDSLLIIVKKR